MKGMCSRILLISVFISKNLNQLHDSFYILVMMYMYCCSLIILTLTFTFMICNLIFVLYVFLLSWP